jgi:2'-5' RNA ligase
MSNAASFAQMKRGGGERVARVFLAFPATGRVESSAARLGSALIEAGFQGAAVPTHQLHLTLLFLGDNVSMSQSFLDFVEQGVTDALAGFPWPSLHISRWVGLPDKWAPRAVAVGPDRPPGPLRDLYDRVTFQLADLGPFARTLVPHLTLMRPRRTGHWNQLPPVSVTFPLTRLVLYQSQVTKAGAVHSPIHMWSADLR